MFHYVAQVQPPHAENMFHAQLLKFLMDMHIFFVNAYDP